MALRADTPARAASAAAPIKARKFLLVSGFARPLGGPTPQRLPPRRLAEARRPQSYQTRYRANAALRMATTRTGGVSPGLAHRRQRRGAGAWPGTGNPCRPPRAIVPVQSAPTRQA